MGELNPPDASLPIINVSHLLSPPGSDTYTSAHAALKHAVLEYGFFYISDTGIEESTYNEVLSLARTFFLETPPEQKARIKRQDPGQGIGDGARGYQLVGENVTQGKRDWHEGIDLYAPIHRGEGADDSDTVEKDGVLHFNERINGVQRTAPFHLLEGVNLWPSSSADFRKNYETYIEKMLSLGTTVVKALGQALDLSDPDVFANSTQNSFWVMRIIGYPPLDASLAAEGGVSCGEHSDYGCLTLLLADETKGALQVLTKQGQWINADPIPGALVVNVGDMIERWTNGYVKSTRHRVIHKSSGFRVSVPFFFEPDRDAEVKPIDDMLEVTGGKPLYESVRYGDFLAQKVGGNFYGASGS